MVNVKHILNQKLKIIVKTILIKLHVFNNNQVNVIGNIPL